MATQLVLILNQKARYSTDDKELMKNIAEALIEQNCKDCKRNSCSCNIRRAFEGWEISSINIVVEGDRC